MPAIAKAKSVNWSSVHISHVSGRDQRTWAIILVGLEAQLGVERGHLDVCTGVPGSVLTAAHLPALI